MYLEVIAVLHYNKHDDVIHACVSKIVFHQSTVNVLAPSGTYSLVSTTAMYVSSSSFTYLCIPCYCDARL